MGSLNITLPDHLKQVAETRARQAGYATLDAYVASLIEADEAVPLSLELESEILKGLATEPRALSPADWDAKRARLRREFSGSDVT